MKNVATRSEKDTASSNDSRQKSNDNAGVVLPPLTIVPPLVSGLLLHFFWKPLGFFPEWWIGHAVGWPLVVAGFLFLAWSVRTMFHAGVDPDPNEPTIAIVATGPYALSRNPDLCLV